jgi:hypothetical protein
VVFDAAAEDSYPSSVKRRAYSFALVGMEGPAVKAERELFSSLKGKVGMVGKADIHC